MATMGGGFQKSDNAPAFQANSGCGATKQLYENNIKDRKPTRRKKKARK